MSIEVKSSSERKCTNVPALVFAIGLISITMILVACCGVFAYKSDNFKFDDFKKVKELKDSCGYICGQTNLFINTTDFNCTNSNMTELPKLITKLVVTEEKKVKRKIKRKYSKRKICVDKCPEKYLDISNECVKEELWPQIVKALKVTWSYILIICFVAFVFSYVFLLLFRHAAKYVIWIINIAFVVFVFALAIWSALTGFTVGLIIFGIMGLIMVILLLCFRKRIALVAKLFKEASKALIDVPSVMFEPILTFISLIISFLIFATFAVIITFAGDDEPLGLPAHICNLISFIFITQFIIGCQNFIIAGTVCRWYFSRDKTKLHKPIKKSFSHLFKFHLGSVCLGAILITIVKIIKAIISSLKNSARDSKNIAAILLATCCMCLFDLLEKLLAFLVCNAYVVIAKEGTPFCVSGKRAYRLLMDNIDDVIALNHFGDLVLFVCRLLIVLIAGCVGYTILSQSTDLKDFMVISMVFGCILAFLIAHCFVMVFEMTVDTIFISFCIDFEENDGQTKPYYMSDSLRKIIADMKEQNVGTNNLMHRNDPGISNRMHESNEMQMLPQQQPPAYQPMSFGYQPQYPQTQQPYPQQTIMPQHGHPSGPYPNLSKTEKYTK